MKTGIVFGILFLVLFVSRSMAQQGLRGEYFNGTNFEQKVLTRIDPQLAFRWKLHSPATGVDQSYYSVRWTGKLLAPVSGRYTFNAKVDDGIRIWVGNRRVMDVWKLNDSKAFTGSIVLEAGTYYDLKVEYFNAMLGGVIELFWVRPDAETSIFDAFGNDGELISSRYFRQSAPPVKAVPKPAMTAPAVATVTAAKPVNKRPVAVSVALPKPVSKPPVVASVTPVDSIDSRLVTKPVAEPLVPVIPASLATKPTVLQHVRFEQSSYVLLAESLPELDKLVQVLQTNPGWRVGLVGHTDNVGDSRINQTLSDYRARVVMHYLTQHGVADHRIDTNGYGGSQPMADNGTETGRASNRRVEFVLK